MRTLRAIVFILLLAFLIVPGVQAGNGPASLTSGVRADKAPRALNTSRVIRVRDASNKARCFVCSDDMTLCVEVDCGA